MITDEQFIKAIQKEIDDVRFLLEIVRRRCDEHMEFPFENPRYLSGYRYAVQNLRSEIADIIRARWAGNLIRKYENMVRESGD